MNDVFISYSRRDKVVTQKLYEALVAANRTVWADWDDIPAASDWFAEIKEGIEQTESVVFLLSPEWIKSNECRKELLYAVEMGKRLFPILWQQVDPKDVPPELARINWVYMRETDDFDKAFQTLCSAMDTDLEWIKTHTRIQVRALEWDKKKRDHSFVLRGKDLADGEQYISGAAHKSPEPTTLQGEYVLASRKDANRRQRLTLTGVTIALVVSVVLGIAALLARQYAVEQAQIAFARELAAAAVSNLTVDPELSILLALQAVSTTYTVNKTVVSEAEDVMRDALKTSRVRVTLSGHSDSVTDIAYSPDGKRLATASVDGTANVWHTTTGQELLTLAGHSTWVNSIAFSPDGSRLATASSDGTVKVWDATTGQELLSLSAADAVLSVAFSPTSFRLATAASDGTAKVWDAASGQELLSLTGHSSQVTEITYSPDGLRLATASLDGTIKVWDATNGQELLSLRGQANGELQILSVAFSPDGTRLAAAGADILGAGAGIAAENTRVWDAVTGNELLTITGHTASVNDIAFSPDGLSLVTASDDGTAKVWDASTGKTLLTLAGHSGGVNGITFSPDGSHVATVSSDKTAKVWNVAIGEEFLWIMLAGHTDFVTDITYSPNGERLATASRDGTAKVWDTASGQELLTLVADTEAVNSVAFSPDGLRLVTASNNNGTVKVWDASTGQELLAGHAEEFNAFAFSPDGLRLATVSQNGTVKVWDADTGQELLILTVDTVLFDSLAFSPDGSRLAAAGSGVESGIAIVWDANTGQELISLIGDPGQVLSIAYSPDGSRLATAGSDGPRAGMAKIWDAATGQELLTLTGHTGWVNSIAFSPDGKRLATASDDGMAKVWDAATGRELFTLSRPTTPYLIFLNIAFSPDGSRLAASSNKSVGIYASSIEELIALARTRLTRAWTLNECQKYLHVEVCPSTIQPTARAQ